MYNNKSEAEGHGRIKFLSLWSDNQFKNKYHFGWGSGFLDKDLGLLAFFKNLLCTMPRQRSCDAVALAALHGLEPISPYDLFKYLKEHCLDVCSKTTSALLSPDRRNFHHFKDG